MVEPLDAYNLVKKSVVSKRSDLSICEMYDYRDKYFFVLEKEGSDYAYDNVYYVDKDSGEITQKHFMESAIEDSSEDMKPIDFSQFEKRVE